MNTLRGLLAASIFMIAFSYLNPYLEQIFKPFERYQRMVVQMTIIYQAFLLFMLHQVSSEQ